MPIVPPDVYTCVHAQGSTKARANVSVTSPKSRQLHVHLAMTEISPVFGSRRVFRKPRQLYLILVTTYMQCARPRSPAPPDICAVRRRAPSNLTAHTGVQVQKLERDSMTTLMKTFPEEMRASCRFRRHDLRCHLWPTLPSTTCRNWHQRRSVARSGRDASTRVVAACCREAHEVRRRVRPCPLIMQVRSSVYRSRRGAPTSIHARRTACPLRRAEH